MRQFSTDKKSIEMFALDINKHIPCASIRKQCYEEHFYGEEGSVEKSFGDLENLTASIINGLTRERCEALTIEHIQTLKSFVHFQAHRTVQASVQFSESMSQMLKHVAKEIPDLDEIDIDMFDIKVTDPQLRVLKAAAEMILITTDLEVKFLINEREIDFLLSDHPVLKCNPFAQWHPKFKNYPSTCGLASKGLILILPLSPRIALVMYDKGTYSIGAKDKRTCGLSKKDALAINAAQIGISYKCLYGHSLRNVGYEMNSFTRIKDDQELYVPTTEEYGQTRRSGQKTSKLVVTHFPSPKIHAQFSFLEITDKNPYKYYPYAAIPIRDPELLNVAKEFASKLEEKYPQPNS